MVAWFGDNSRVPQLTCIWMSLPGASGLGNLASVETKTTHFVGKGLKAEPSTIEGGGLKEFGSVKTMIVYKALHQSHQSLLRDIKATHLFGVANPPLKVVELEEPGVEICKLYFYIQVLLQISISLSSPTFLFQALAPCPYSSFRLGDHRPLLPEP